MLQAVLTWQAVLTRVAISASNPSTVGRAPYSVLGRGYGCGVGAPGKTDRREGSLANRAAFGCVPRRSANGRIWGISIGQHFCRGDGARTIQAVSHARDASKD